MENKEVTIMKKLIYLVADGIDIHAYTSEEQARKEYEHIVKDSWESCIKFSCPKGEFYDDYGRTLRKALLEHYTMINRRTIIMRPVVMEEENA